ncbi:MAG: signal peptidase II [Ruthenibacterium sp.]
MIFTVFLTAALVILDQITKMLATTYLAPVGVLPFIPGVMQLRYILNDGAAFSILSGNRFFLIAVTSVALLALTLYLLFKKPQSRFEHFAWVLILAGGIGNLIDRVLNGVVVDFFEVTFMNFAVFNVADCFVCVGAALLLLFFVLEEVKNKKGTSHADS